MALRQQHGIVRGPIKNPPWSKKEIRALIGAMSVHGHKLDKIHALLPSRSKTAINSRIVGWKAKYKKNPECLESRI